MSIVIAVIFSVVCFGVAITGITSLDGITDPEQLSDAKGFAGFWAFLGSVGVVCGAASYWILRTAKEEH
jgi:hypothetical protein